MIYAFHSNAMLSVMLHQHFYADTITQERCFIV